MLRITQQAEAGSGLETRFADGFGRCRGTGLRLPLALYSQEGRWNDSPCNQSLPSICKKAGQLSQGATEEDHGCRKVRVLLELGAGVGWLVVVEDWLKKMKGLSRTNR